MGLSVFLAKLIGFYLLIAGLLCLFRKRQIEATAKEFAASKPSLVVSGEISLILGLIIAIDHSIWEYSWRGLITLIGYLLIVRGIMRFAFPSQVKKLFSKIIEKSFGLMLIVMLGIGTYLVYCGFTQ